MNEKRRKMVPESNEVKVKFRLIEPNTILFNHGSCHRKSTPIQRLEADELIQAHILTKLKLDASIQEGPLKIEQAKS